MTSTALLFLMIATGPAPSIETPMPSAVPLGRAREVVLRGAHLSGVRRVVITGGSGVRGTVVAARPQEVRLRITLDGRTSLRTRELRVIGPNGASNAVPLAISALPVVTDAEAGATVSLPATLCGTISAPAEVDRFRFTATAGTTLVFDVTAVRKGSALDPFLRVRDAEGRTVAWNEMRPHGDPLVVFLPTRDGTFTLSVRDVQYRGGQALTYRIRAGALPYVTSIFPLGGRRGELARVTARGHNLGKQAEIDVDLTSPKTKTGLRNVAFGDGALTSNARRLRVSDVTESMEVEPNDTRETASPAAIPFAGNGRIDRPGDVDHFRFSVERKRTLEVVVAARRLGSPLDALLVLRDAQGKQLAVNDDRGGPDPRIRHTFGPGTYTVTVRSLVHRGGADHTYRLSIVPPVKIRPGYHARFLPDAPRVSRGSHVKLWCEAVRYGGYDGAIDVRFEGLPPGVTASRLRLTADNQWTSVFTLSAAPDAPLGATPFVLRTTAEGVADGRKKASPEAAGTVRREAFLSVLPAPPFTVAPVTASSDAEAKELTRQLEELERTLATTTPELAERQRAWEARLRQRIGHWTSLTPKIVKSETGLRFEREKGDVVHVASAVAERDTYTLVLASQLERMTGIRLDALPAKKLPGGGPGLAGNGNFVLTGFEVSARSRDGGDQFTAVRLVHPEASFAQARYPITHTLDGKDQTGWAIQGNLKAENNAAWTFAAPVHHPAGIELRVVIRHQSRHARHLLGRFRLSATGDARPRLGLLGLPPHVQRILRTPTDARSPKTQRRLAAYFRTIAPELDTARRRRAEIRARQVPFPPRVVRNAKAEVVARITRRPGFTGPVTVSLEGFSSGRVRRRPRPITEDVRTRPRKIAAERTLAHLSIHPKKKSATGTRLVVIRATAKIGPHTLTEYSRPFPLTVTEK